MRPIFEPFDEYERLARNKPHPGIAAHLPKVTEGTLASTILKQPRRTIQQVLTGKVKFDGDSGLSPVLQVLLDNKIIPKATTGGSIIQKGWEATTKALTYGAQPILSFYTRHGSYFGADCRLPYVRDVFLEKGQTCAGDSQVIFLVSWYTEAQIKTIIRTEKWLIEQSKQRGDLDRYKSSWDLSKLAQLLNKGVTKKKVESQTPGERQRGSDAGGYQIITAFQDGVGAEFYSFAPALSDTGTAATGENIVRVKVNNDPRGVIPIRFQYHTVDGSNPLGRGAVEHSGSVQNLIDSQLQMFQYNMSLIQAPPIKKWGNLPNKTFRMAPDAIWEMGNDKTNDAVPVQIATQGISSFSDNFGLLKSILITGLNGQDTSISASAGNPGFSKTNAGVKQQNAILGVDDNYIRKQYETAWGLVMEDMLNIHITESVGVLELVLEDHDIEKLESIYPEVRENGGVAKIIYDNIRGSASISVDAGTSAGEDDAEQSEIISNLIEVYTNNAVIQQRLEQEGFKFSIGELFNRQVVKSGVEDPEKIISKLTPEEIQAKQQEDMALAAQAQPQEDPNADDGFNGLRDMGLDEDQINHVMQMLQEGKSADEMIASLYGLQPDMQESDQLLLTAGGAA
ncbi:MAG TPA: hypothetical protein VJ841_03545 [Candidatus Saccharimonadales bacterium]|nr:hypothetical protein [Candidatus Saccharimonadales bacterium]